MRTSSFAALVLALALLAGCGTLEEQAREKLDEAAGQAQEKLNDVLAQAGEKIVDALDELENAEYQNGPFENNEESARAYLLAQLKEKYGEEFIVTGREDLKNYGAIAGATYRCQAAPADQPEKVFDALVSQTKYRKVRDDYAVWFYKEEAEAPVLAFCQEFDYVLDQKVSLEMPETPATWTGEDNLKFFLNNSGAYVKVVLRLEDGRDADFYAEQLLDFLSRVKELDCDLLLQARTDKSYIYHRELSILKGFDPAAIPLEDIREDVEIMMKVGPPRTAEELEQERAKREAEEAKDEAEESSPEEIQPEHDEGR